MQFPSVEEQLAIIRRGVEKIVPEEERGRYHTLSGMVMWLLGRLPRTGDIVTWEEWRLEVVDLDGKRIDKVLASRVTEVESTTE